MNPVVSVIMPVRNGGDYLEDAVQSILDQSLESLELILVDDHSDDSAIDAIANTDERLVILKSDGNGVSRAFNTGLARAQGAFIARMDADDIALSNRLESQLEYLKQNPGIDICGACVKIFTSGQLAGGNQRYQDWLNACCSPEAIERELFIESPIPNPTAVFRRDALLQLDSFGDPDWPEDYDLYLRADMAGMRMGKPGGILLHWREHENRLTRKDPRYKLERFQAAKAYYLSRHRLRGKGPVVIWGAGDSGRLFHDLLVGQGVSIEGFLEVHPRRIGGQKRGLPVWPVEQVGALQDRFILVAVGAAGAREKIRAYLQKQGRREGEDYLFVA